jgi:molybdopterin converting factor small subunit
MVCSVWVPFRPAVFPPVPAIDTQPMPGLADRLLENGALRRFINIYVNDEDVRFIGSLTAQLKSGDSITILPAVAGG